MDSMSTVTNHTGSTLQATPCQIALRRRTGIDGEIGVFRAEKYFKGGMDDKKTTNTGGGSRNWPNKDAQIDPINTNLNIKPGTPSARSEASWTSQSALLPTILNAGRITRRNRASGKQFFTKFSCKCICSDKKAVDIEENVGENKSLSNGKKMKKEQFNVNTNPIRSIAIKQSRLEPQFKERTPYQNFGKENLGLQFSKSVVGNAAAASQCEQMMNEKERESLEVFGSPIMEIEDTTLSLENKLGMLTWDISAGAEDIQVNPAAGVQDGAESDSSSDLFEIKNFSEYAPTEASFDWSIVTASATNFSTMSNFDEEKSEVKQDKVIFHTKTTPTTTKTKTTTTTKTEEEVGKKHPGGLWGCRNEEAVTVAGDANRKEMLNAKRHHRSDSYAPAEVFQNETKVAEFQSTRARRAAVSAEASQSLHTH